MKKLFKKGVTLAEVVVSMAIITIISVITISIIEKGYEQTFKSSYYSQARLIASNSYEAFKYSNSFKSFNQAMNKSGITYNSFQKSDNQERYTLTYDLESIIVIVELNYNETGTDFYQVTCKKTNNKEIFHSQYNKPHTLEVNYE